MTRLHALAAHPRRTLAALAVVLAAVGITVGSGANFTASAASPGNSFATGTLSMTAPNTAVFTSAGMKPGDTVTGNVSIQNTGSLSGGFKLATANPTGTTTLLGQLNTVVTDCGTYTTTPPSCTGGTDVYTGTLAGLSNVNLGTYAGGDKHYYKIAVTLDSSTDNTFQGKTAGIDFSWSATQS